MDLSGCLGGGEVKVVTLGLSELWSNVCIYIYCIYWCGPLPATVTRSTTFLVENPYEPLFTTVTGRGPRPNYIYIYIIYIYMCILHIWILVVFVAGRGRIPANTVKISV